MAGGRSCWRAIEGIETAKMPSDLGAIGKALASTIARIRVLRVPNGIHQRLRKQQALRSCFFTSRAQVTNLIHFILMQQRVLPGLI